MKSKLFYFLLISSFFVACKDDKKAVGAGNFTSGAFVTCEGQFPSGSGTVTFFNESLPEPLQDIFGAQNTGAAVGIVLQSMAIIGDKAYLVVNGANKIVVVNAKTFIFEAEITGLFSPRYLTSTGNGKAYATQWGASGYDGSVAIIDLATNKVTKTLTGVGAGCERMFFVDDELLVLNKGGFGVDSTITSINYKVDTIFRRIKTGDVPSSIASSTDGNLWLLTSGAYDFVSGASTPAKLGKLSGDGTISYPNGSFNSIPQGADDLVVNIDGDLFFNNPGENQISVVRRNSNTITKFASGYFYGLASKEDQVWATDAKDFSSAGQVIIFDNDGTRRDSFPTGVVPAEIYFKF